jgi:nucleotide-binding universal stress UspA family protein
LLVVKQRLRGPYAKIMVATDFSELSRHALRTVAAFFPDSKLDIFHAFDDPKSGLVGDPEQREAAGRKAATSAALAFLAGAGLPDERQRGVGVVVEKGYPAEVLPQYVRDRGVDLVVLGRTGRSALFDLFLGSIAKDMLSALPCDVLVVREPLATATA